MSSSQQQVFSPSFRQLGLLKAYKYAGYSVHNDSTTIVVQLSPTCTCAFDIGFYNEQLHKASATPATSPINYLFISQLNGAHCAAISSVIVNSSNGSLTIVVAQPLVAQITAIVEALKPLTAANNKQLSILSIELPAEEAAEAEANSSTANIKYVALPGQEKLHVAAVHSKAAVSSFSTNINSGTSDNKDNNSNNVTTGVYGYIIAERSEKLTAQAVQHIKTLSGKERETYLKSTPNIYNTVTKSLIAYNIDTTSTITKHCKDITTSQVVIAPCLVDFKGYLGYNENKIGEETHEFDVFARSLEQFNDVTCLCISHLPCTFKQNKHATHKLSLIIFTNLC